MKRVWQVLGAAIAASAALAAPASAATLFSDGAESGSLAEYAEVVRAGDGIAEAQSGVVRTGGYAMRLAATANSASQAYARAQLPGAQTDLRVTADVQVRGEGPSGGNVPIVRLFDAANTRLVSLYRQNLSSDKLYVQHSGTFNLTTGRLPLATWGRLELHVVTAGSGLSTVEAWLDGTLIYRSQSASLGSGGILWVQFGNDLARQPFDVVADNVTVTNANNDVTPPNTTITGGPMGTVESGTASFDFTASESGAGFECRIDATPWAACGSPRVYNGLSDGTHTFSVRARDAAGNPDPSPATRTWTVALGDGCDSGAPDPDTTDPGDLVVADNFENGLGKWKITTQGDAAITTEGDNAHGARCAGRLHVTTAVWDSRANLTKVLPTRTNEVWADGWFNTEREGVDSNWNTPTFRFLSNGKRVLDVSRQNVSGNFFVRFPNPAGGWTITNVGKKLTVGRWYHVKVHTIAAEGLSTVQVWLDGVSVYDNRNATLGVSRIDVQMVGAEHQNQEGDLAVDDVVIKAKAPPPTDVVFSDGFESGNLGGWSTVQTGGDGTAVAQTSIVKTGTTAGRLTATANAGSVAYLRKALSAAQTDLTASANVRLLSEGVANQTVPLLTLNDAGGVRVVSLFRINQNGNKISLQDGTRTYTTTGTLPLDQWANVKVHVITSGNGAGLLEAWINDVLIFRSTTADLGVTGGKTLQVGNNTSARAYSLVVDDVLMRTGTNGPGRDPRYKLLLADHLNNRLLITDFDGNVVWKFNNPTGNSDYTAGPIGVRWMPGNQILATFGTGEVGVIDVATKTWVWQTKGYDGDWFQSPYDAEMLPDGNLAVALRFNNGGRISVFNPLTGDEVWRYYLSNAHAIHYRTPAQSYNSDEATLLVGGWGSIREVAYRPGVFTNVTTWQVKTEYTHDALVVENDNILTTEGYYLQKINRAGTQLWKKSTPDEDRRIAVNPNLGGGYIVTVAESDRVEFRDVNGNLLRDWSMLSDGTGLDFPYGVQVVEYPG